MTFLLLGFVFFSEPTLSSDTKKKVVAMVISIDGTACSRSHNACSPITVGSKLVAGSIIVVDGQVSLVDLDDKRWKVMNSGTYTMQTSEWGTEQEEINYLFNLLNTNKRTTAVNATRILPLINSNECQVTSPTKLCYVRTSGPEDLTLDHNNHPIPLESNYINLPSKVTSSLPLIQSKTYPVCQESVGGEIIINSDGIRVIQTNTEKLFVVSPLSENCHKKFSKGKEKLNKAFNNKSSKLYYWSLFALYKRYELNYDALRVLDIISNLSK